VSHSCTHSPNHMPCPIPVHTVPITCLVPFLYTQSQSHAVSHSCTQSPNHMPCPIPVHTVPITCLVPFLYTQSQSHAVSHPSARSALALQLACCRQKCPMVCICVEFLSAQGRPCTINIINRHAFPVILL
jgi:hypothetical protein